MPLFFHRYPTKAIEFSGWSGSITHGDRKAYDACRYYGALIVAALRNEDKDQLLDIDFYENHKEWFRGTPLLPDIMAIAKGSYKKDGYKGGIRAGGYILTTLQAALWAFWSDGGSFKTGVLNAVNLGDDADTVAAVYGQLAGAYYGYQTLPKQWIRQLYAKDFIETLSKWIIYEGSRWSPKKSSMPNIMQATVKRPPEGNNQLSSEQATNSSIQLKSEVDEKVRSNLWAEKRNVRSDSYVNSDHSIDSDSIYRTRGNTISDPTNFVKENSDEKSGSTPPQLEKLSKRLFSIHRMISTFSTGNTK